MRGTSEPQTGFYRTFRIEPPLFRLPFKNSPYGGLLRLGGIVTKSEGLHGVSELCRVILLIQKGKNTNEMCWKALRSTLEKV